MKSTMPPELSVYPNPLTPYYERYRETKQIDEKAKRSGTSEEKTIAENNFTAAEQHLRFQMQGWYSDEVRSMRVKGAARELLRFKIDAKGNEAAVEIELWEKGKDGDMFDFLVSVGRKDLVKIVNQHSAENPARISPPKFIFEFVKIQRLLFERREKKLPLPDWLSISEPKIKKK